MPAKFAHSLSLRALHAARYSAVMPAHLQLTTTPHAHYVCTPACDTLMLMLCARCIVYTSADRDAHAVRTLDLSSGITSTLMGKNANFGNTDGAFASAVVRHTSFGH